MEQTKIQGNQEFLLPEGPLCEVILKFESGEELKYNYTNSQGNLVTIFGEEENMTAGNFDAEQAAQAIVSIAEALGEGIGSSASDILQYLATITTFINPEDAIIGSILEVIEGEGKDAKRSRRSHKSPSQDIKG